MKLKYIFISCLSLLGFIGCDDFEDINTNPDESNRVTSEMLATHLLTQITYEV